MGTFTVAVICLTVIINFGIMVYALYQPFKEALTDRESTGLGRCLRYCCKVQLPESRKCFCDCCTCGDETKEVPSKYPRVSFFVIQPLHCQTSETMEAVDVESVLEISSDEESKVEDSYHLEISGDEDDDDA